MRKNFLETVGAAMILKTNDTYIDHADKTLSLKVGGTLTAAAPELYVEAKTKIELRCGNSTITLTTKSVEIKAQNLDLSKCENLYSKTKTIEHN